MPYPSKFKKLEAESGEPAKETVLRLLNEHTSLSEAARQLNMSTAALFHFVHKNNIVKVVRWEDHTA